MPRGHPTSERTIHCKRCGGATATRSGRQEYCGDPCRRADRLDRFAVETACEWCGRPCTGYRKASRFCRPCRTDVGRGNQSMRLVSAPCLDCAADFPPTRARRRYCPPCSRRRHRMTNRRHNDKRRGVVRVDEFDLFDLAARDGWRCHLCAGLCDPLVDHLHADYPTVDHLTPISLGGVGAWANVALAHRRCNQLRGVRPVGEARELARWR